MKRQNRFFGSNSGATILEVLVVLTIIALIAAAVGPRVIGYLGKAKSETAELKAQSLSSAVQLFFIDTGRYPAESEGLRILLDKPAADTSWNGPYIVNEDALTDPWGRLYGYVPPLADEKFRVTSLGRDGVEGGKGEDEDISY